MELKKIVARLNVDQLSAVLPETSSCKNIVDMFDKILHPLKKFDQEALTTVEKGFVAAREAVSFKTYEFPKFQLVKAPSVSAGSWRMCPKKHVYAVTLDEETHCRDCAVQQRSTNPRNFGSGWSEWNGNGRSRVTHQSWRQRR